MPPSRFSHAARNKCHRTIPGFLGLPFKQQTDPGEPAPATVPALAQPLSSALANLTAQLDDRVAAAFLRLEPSSALTVDQLVNADCPHYAAFEFIRKAKQLSIVDAAGKIAPELRAHLTAALKGKSNSGTATTSASENRPAGLAHLPEEERPRERLIRLGAQALSAEELVAILLRTGSADRGVLEPARDIITEHDGLLGLAGKDYAELQEIAGLGNAKIASLAAALEVGRRLGQVARRPRPPLTDPDLVAGTFWRLN